MEDFYISSFLACFLLASFEDVGAIYSEGLQVLPVVVQLQLRIGVTPTEEREQEKPKQQGGQIASEKDENTFFSFEDYVLALFRRCTCCCCCELILVPFMLCRQHSPSLSCWNSL